MPYIDDAERRFAGAIIDRVTRRDHSWDFGFSVGSLDVEHNWRLLQGGALLLTDREDGRAFGGVDAFDVEIEASKYLVGRRVLGAIIDPETADLRISIDGGVRLEILTTSRITAWTFSGDDFTYAAVEGRITSPGWFLSDSHRA